MNTDQVIQLEKVNKWYDDFHVLKDIDLIVDKGQKIVICGPSGSGKSTILNLIPRFYEAHSGNIKIDDQSIYDSTLETLRKNISLVCNLELMNWALILK